jgi:hypothetical protein
MVRCSSSTEPLIIDQLHSKSQRLLRIIAASQVGIFMNVAQLEVEIEPKGYIARNIQ